MKKLTALLFTMTMAMVGFSQNHWVPNIYQFPTNMNIIAIIEINGIEQQNNYLELGVFCETECRGSQMLGYYNPPINRFMLFLTAYGEDGDPFTFRLYDHLTEQELDFSCSNEMTYGANDIIGSLFNPYIFSFSSGEDCVLSLTVEPEGAGSVEGGGIVPCGTLATVRAIPVEEGSFLGWTYLGDTLSTDEEFSIPVLSDIELVAHFTEVIEPVFYEIEAEASPEEGGTIVGVGFYEEGETCSLSVNLNPNYEFVNWTEDGVEVSTENAYSFEVYGNRNLVANLVYINGVEDGEIVHGIYPNPSHGRVWVSGADDDSVTIYDMKGRALLTTSGNPIDLSDFDNGVYLVRLGSKLQKLVLYR